MVRRAGSPLAALVRVDKEAGEPLGVEVSSAVFDRIRTCDNHCAFCFIYQLPKGMRRSLYLKDDDYRLSFLYGNFTTLTRFTELDAERILTERLGPLFVSIHTTDPDLRAHMLRNPKGATSLRWLGVLLDGGIEVHGQIVVCPGVNDGAALEDTLAGILDRYPGAGQRRRRPARRQPLLDEPEMRPHTVDEAAQVLDTIERVASVSSDARWAVAWSSPPTSTTSWPGGTCPRRTTTTGTPSTRTASAWSGPSPSPSADQAPTVPVACATASSPRWTARPPRATARPRLPSAPAGEDARPVTILTGTYGARVLAPLLAVHPRADVALRGGAQRLLRRQHRCRRPADGRGPRTGARECAGGPALPPARRLPQRRTLPRRVDPGRSASTRRSRADRRRLAAPGPGRHVVPPDLYA